MLILPGNESISDSIKYNKNCRDFQILDDGTIVGDYHYCNLSNYCRQIDITNGIPIPMESNYLPIFDPLTNEIEWLNYCTGMYDLRSLKERIEDDKAH
jgi:hypothetical protein